MSDQGRDKGRERSGPQGTMLFQGAALPETETSEEQSHTPPGGHPVLVGVVGPFRQQRLTLKPGKQSVGRQGDNDIVLQEDSVSSQHAWLVNDSGACRVVNLLSTNGTWVNERKVHEATLNDGDHVRFGRAEFIFRHRDDGSEVVPTSGVRRSSWRWIGLAVAILVLAAVARVLLEST
ncbi:MULTISPECIES: FHA domain-containing protein [unclassified Thioalkalivibrio]|uniref:FHA domain-containing protein n=1 Tax=unclassified Thioalkalivibrio TaxID=2621013 RepID=UPI0003822DDE|nr:MULTISPECIES: FHA domain-containing protein [unclassified Thioalkalivibrio]